MNENPFKLRVLSRYQTVGTAIRMGLGTNIRGLSLHVERKDMLATLLVAAALATVTPSPSPHPSATPAAALTVIAHTTTTGRKTNLVGTAQAASEGTIGPGEIATRPILRPGEVLEAIPGLVISQHSGEGKANQYYLRGFQLDHGTDLESTVFGIPVNLPTHAHGQGYSDVNWLIPELVSDVTYQKGPYYAGHGDFSTAGAYDVYYRNTIDPVAELSAGSYGYDRLFFAASPRAGAGTLLYAAELGHDNGSSQRPDEYRKFNGLLRWSRAENTSSFSVTAAGYGGRFDSSDQIPQRLLTDGTLSRFGLVDPSDGGTTYRYSLSSEYAHTDAHGTTHLQAYGAYNVLDLFSNFTYDLADATDYYNVTANPVTCSTVYTTCTPGAKHVGTYTSYCPANVTPASPSAPAKSLTPQPFTFACGDQREQEDVRFISGANVSRSFTTRTSTTTLGASLRNDNISTVGLFLTRDRVRFGNGTLSDAHVVERSTALYADSELRVGPRLRLAAGLRGDLYDFDVAAFQQADSGKRVAGIVDPKFRASYELTPHQELYADFGESYHSNDARGITQTLDPQTHTTIDPQGQAVQQVSPLVRGVGDELGYRYSGTKFTSTLTLWQLHLASELTFNGDDGTTSPGPPTLRRGIELANFFTPAAGLTIDADFATSAARFLADPLHVGTGVPESLNAVVALGVTEDRPGYAASVRLRYFGPRTLDTQGDAVSAPSTLVNAQLTRKLSGLRRLTLDVLNALDAPADDVEYFYGSFVPQDLANPALAKNPAINPLLGGNGANDFHVHPAQKRTLRLSYSFGV